MKKNLYPTTPHWQRPNPKTLNPLVKGMRTKSSAKTRKTSATNEPSAAPTTPQAM